MARDNLAVTLNVVPIKQVIRKNPKVFLHENLTWINHFDEIAKKVSSGIGALKRVRGLINQKITIKADQGFTELYLSYYTPARDGIGETFRDKLQKLQNRVARLRVFHILPLLRFF